MGELFLNVDKILKMWEMWDHWAPCKHCLVLKQFILTQKENSIFVRNKRETLSDLLIYEEYGETPATRLDQVLQILKRGENC